MRTGVFHSNWSRAQKADWKQVSYRSITSYCHTHAKKDQNWGTWKQHKGVNHSNILHVNFVLYAPQITFSFWGLLRDSLRYYLLKLLVQGQKYICLQQTVTQRSAMGLIERASKIWLCGSIAATVHPSFMNRNSREKHSSLKMSFLLGKNERGWIWIYLRMPFY